MWHVEVWNMFRSRRGTLSYRRAFYCWRSYWWLGQFPIQAIPGWTHTSSFSHTLSPHHHCLSLADWIKEREGKTRRDTYTRVTSCCQHVTFAVVKHQVVCSHNVYLFIRLHLYSRPCVPGSLLIGSSSDGFVLLQNLPCGKGIGNRFHSDKLNTNSSFLFRLGILGGYKYRKKGDWEGWGWSLSLLVYNVIRANQWFDAIASGTSSKMPCHVVSYCTHVITYVLLSHLFSIVFVCFVPVLLLLLLLLWTHSGLVSLFPVAPTPSMYNWWVVKQRYESHPGSLESALKALKRCLVVTGNGEGREGWTGPERWSDSEAEEETIRIEGEN